MRSELRRRCQTYEYEYCLVYTSLVICDESGHMKLLEALHSGFCGIEGVATA